MMKKFIAPLLALLVSGCQIDPYTHAPTGDAANLLI